MSPRPWATLRPARRTVHFGTGKVEKIERVEIRWPSGIVQILRNLATNQVLEVHEPSK